MTPHGEGGTRLFEGEVGSGSGLGPDGTLVENEAEQVVVARARELRAGG